MTLLQGKAGWGLLIALALVFPYVVPNNYFLSVMTLSYIFAIAALGLNLITGYTGQFNLAHGGFMAIGAYALSKQKAILSRLSAIVPSFQPMAVSPSR